MSNCSLAFFTMGVPRGGGGPACNRHSAAPGLRQVASDHRRGGDFLMAITGDFVMATDTVELRRTSLLVGLVGMNSLVGHARGRSVGNRLTRQEIRTATAPTTGLESPVLSALESAPLQTEPPLGCSLPYGAQTWRRLREEQSRKGEREEH